MLLLQQSGAYGYTMPQLATSEASNYDISFENVGMGAPPVLNLCVVPRFGMSGFVGETSVCADPWQCTSPL